MRTEIYCISDKGNVRLSNQDSYLIDKAHGIYVVADGMGGHEDGEIASKTACADIVSSIVETIADDRHQPKDSELLVALAESIRSANSAIGLLNNGKDGIGAMGTTVACVVLSGQTLFYGNVGDTRIYYIEKDQKRLRIFSRDHTLEAQSIERGMPPDFAARFRHTLTQAVGTKGEVEPTIGKFPVLSAGTLLVASDGLHNYFEAPELEAVLVDENCFETDVTNHLLNLALARGGEDNITIVQVNVIY